MKIKLSITFCLGILLLGNLTAQKGLYVEGAVKVEGGMAAMLGKMWNSSYKHYQKKEKTLVQIEKYNTKQFMLTVGENVSLVDGKDCYSDTKTEIAKYDNEDYKIENVDVVNNTETTRILGYECKSAVISYSGKANGTSFNTSVRVWYTDKINTEEVGNTLALQGTEQDNDYTKALRKLGFVLRTEQTEVGMTITTSITKVEIKDIGDDVFSLDTKKCKKMMSYKEFKEEMKKRMRRADMGMPR